MEKIVTKSSLSFWCGNINKSGKPSLQTLITQHHKSPSTISKSASQELLLYIRVLIHARLSWSVCYWKAQPLAVL